MMSNIENSKLKKNHRIFMITFITIVLLCLFSQFLLVSNYIFSIKFVPEKIMYNNIVVFNSEENKYLNPFTRALLPIKNHQKKRLRSYRGDIDTVLLGDSSLGYGIDTPTFSKITNSNTIKLALSGAAGIEGALGMLLEVNKKHNVKNVVLVFRTAQFIKHFYVRSFVLGVVKSQSNFSSTLRSHPFIVNEFIKTMFSTEISMKSLKMILSKKNKNRSDANLSFEGEYYPLLDRDVFLKRNIPIIDTEFKTWHRESIDNYLFYTLESIQKICKKNNINCIYSHGPMLELDCKKQEMLNPDYLSYINEKIIDIGFALQNKAPFCFPKKYFTDKLIPGLFVNIVNEKHKKDVTKKYSTDIKRLLIYND